MCAPDSIRSARCLLRGCPDGGHANDQLKFPDRNDLIQSANMYNCLILSTNLFSRSYETTSFTVSIRVLRLILLLEIGFECTAAS